MSEEIHCRDDGNYLCQNKTLNCEDTSTSCVVTCENQACKSATINCADNVECIINCTQYRSCVRAKIYGNHATSLTVLTSTLDSQNECLLNAEIHCNSTSTCDITCTANHNQCKQLKIYAEDAGKLIFTCDHYQNKQCINMSIYCPTDYQEYKCQINGLEGIEEIDIYSKNGFKGVQLQMSGTFNNVPIGRMHCCSEYKQICDIDLINPFGCSEESQRNSLCVIINRKDCPEPTAVPSNEPTEVPTEGPTNEPTEVPIPSPTTIPTDEITNEATTTSPVIYTTNTPTNTENTQTETHTSDFDAQGADERKQMDTLLHIIVPMTVLLCLCIVIGIVVFIKLQKQKQKQEIDKHPTVSGPSELNMVPVMVPDMNKIRRGSTIEFYQNNDNENDGSIDLQQEGVSSITKIPQQEQISSAPQYNTPGGPSSEPNELINGTKRGDGENSKSENDIPKFNNAPYDDVATKGQDSDSDIYESDD